MDERVACCHLIASILAADGIMTDSERDFLAGAMARAGLSESERDQVTHFEGAEGAVEAARQLPEERRRELIDDLLNASLVDGRLSPLETKLVAQITEALGLAD